LNSDNSSRIQRNDFRAKTNYPFWFRKLDIESAKSIESPWHHCYTLDLSAGGALISTDLEDLAPGDHIEFELIIPGGPVFGIAKIVRTIEEERERQLGLMFVSMAAKDKDRIAQVVLSDGLEKRNNEFS